MLGNHIPRDNVFVQLNQENQFFGQMLSNIFNAVTFGLFKSKDDKPHSDKVAINPEASGNDAVSIVMDSSRENTKSVNASEAVVE